jgi:O-antigen ligase
LFLLFAVAQASHLEQPLHRWEALGEHISADARLAAARVALQALPQAGVLGFGPGTFRAVFPTFAKAAELLPLSGQWRFLHQDYLQTAMEWGWLGSLVWALLFFGGIVVAIRNLRKIRDSSWRHRVILLMSIFALGGVALHALVDFPLQIESIQLYVATCLGVCWSSSSWKTRQR